MAVLQDLRGTTVLMRSQDSPLSVGAWPCARVVQRHEFRMTDSDVRFGLRDRGTDDSCRALAFLIC